MALQLPHRTLRRAAVTAAFGAVLLAPAAEAKSKKAKPKLPVVSQVSPMRLAVGDTLTVRGRNFNANEARTSVKFRAPDGRQFNAKAVLATRKLVKVVVPESLAAAFDVRDGVRVATTFRLAVLSTKLSKRFTKPAGSPVITPKAPPAPPVPPAPLPPFDGDCDKDRVLDSVDPDDDNDLLADTEERPIGLDSCNADSDGDGVADGYELRSARDLNSSAVLPAPVKRPYPNPLFGDASVDYDGDGLTLRDEHALWTYELRRTGRPASLETLSYSDGTKHSIYSRDASGRRVPALPAAGYDRAADFRAWLDATGFGTVDIPRDTGPRSLFDFNRDGQVSEQREPGYPVAEALHLDSDRSGWLSDNERDEDADGLSNIDESHTKLLFRMNPAYWAERYAGRQDDEKGIDRTGEKPFPGAGLGSGIDYERTHYDDPDADGDGVRDGADDEDFDDVPNLMELSRWAATGRLDSREASDPDVTPGLPAFGRVNPFNPCLPDRRSRTCPTYLPEGDEWAPFDESPDYFSFG